MKYGLVHGQLLPDGSLVNVREVDQGDILKCPQVMLVASHYREDGSCKCDDAVERSRMIAELGYSASDFKDIPLRD